MTAKKTETAIELAERDVAMARDVVDGLVEQRRALEQTAPARKGEMDAISYKALVEGNKAAQTRLAEIHAAAAKHGSELAAIDAATAEAQHRLADKEARLEQEIDRENAEQVLSYGDEMVAEAAAFDAAVKSLAQATERFLAAHRKTIALGVDSRGIPNLMTVDLFLKRAIASYPVLQLLLRTGVDLAPVAARITASEVATHWRREYQAWAAPRLAGEPDIAEAAE